MKKSLLVALLVLLWIPAERACAAVVIHEIAWMGNGVSANDEWVELYNNGSDSVSLEGWTLVDGVALSIPLSGTIGAGKYAVLERTDDGSAPGSAFLIYTGALPNTGTTLTLQRENGSTEDQVAGGENWESIGGDNTTKETAQYTVSGWVTAAPTPGTANAISGTKLKEEGSDLDDEEETSDSTVKNNNTKQAESAKLVLPDVTLSLSLFAPDRAYVHQPVLFSMQSSGIGKTLLDSLQYTWNFGDLESATGKEVQHAYDHPGEYVVMAEGSFARQRAVVRHEITVLPVSFEITHASNGDVLIHNNAKYEVDISGYSIRGSETFIVPPHSLLLPNATLHVPKSRIGNSAIAWLFDQDASVVASTFQPSTAALASAQEYTPLFTGGGGGVIDTSAPVAALPQETRFGFGSNASDTSEASVAHELPHYFTQDVEDLSAAVQDVDDFIPREKLPYIALIGVIALGTLALFTGRMKL